MQKKCQPVTWEIMELGSYNPIDYRILKTTAVFHDLFYDAKMASSNCIHEWRHRCSLRKKCRQLYTLWLWNSNSSCEGTLYWKCGLVFRQNKVSLRYSNAIIFLVIVYCSFSSWHRHCPVNWPFMYTCFGFSQTVVPVYLRSQQVIEIRITSYRSGKFLLLSCY